MGDKAGTQLGGLFMAIVWVGLEGDVVSIMWR